MHLPSLMMDDNACGKPVVLGGTGDCEAVEGVVMSVMAESVAQSMLPVNLVSLPACCLDLDILLEDIIFPERMDSDGREFFSAHELDSVTLRKLRKGAINLGGGMVKIKHRCAQLLDDGRCGIYETRPKICRDFDCTTRHDCACQGRGKLP